MLETLRTRRLSGEALRVLSELEQPALSDWTFKWFWSLWSLVIVAVLMMICEFLVGWAAVRNCTVFIG